MMIGGMAIDITQRIHAEQALRTSERLYRAIGESIDFGVWVCDPEGRNIYAELVAHRRFPADIFAGSEQNLSWLRMAIEQAPE